MKKIECDFCNKIVNENSSAIVSVKPNSSLTGIYFGFNFDVCKECANKLKEKAKRSKEGD